MEFIHVIDMDIPIISHKHLRFSYHRQLDISLEDEKSHWHIISIDRQPQVQGRDCSNNSVKSVVDPHGVINRKACPIEKLI
jgi:hypothetical protein